MSNVFQLVNESLYCLRRKDLCSFLVDFSSRNTEKLPFNHTFTPFSVGTGERSMVIQIEIGYIVNIEYLWRKSLQ